jgi:hypothetical protein
VSKVYSLNSIMNCHRCRVFECGRCGNRLVFVQGANMVLLSITHYPLHITVYRSWGIVLT